ncbi:MAG: hypothetical protein ABW005_12520 [Burkholderiaceae bacterium]
MRRPLSPLFSALPLLAALLLGGCTGLGSRDPGVTPGVSSGADVIARYGRPTRVWPDADGGQTLEYASQPRGQTCYMVKLAPDGRLVRIEDTLLEASRWRVEAGWTEEQVSRLLGTERSRVFFRFSGEDVWDWNVAPDQTGYRLRFNVHFKDHRVVRTSQSMVFPSRFGLLDD